MSIKSVKIIKIIIWTAMLACIIFDSLTTDVTGIIPHIVAGCVLFMLSVAHIFLSRKYFCACIKNLFSKKLKAKARLNCIIDFLLIGLLVGITVTGIGISPDALAGQVVEGAESFHGILSAVFVLLSIVHGCLHIRRKRKKSIN